MAITPTTGISSLRVLISKMKNAYWFDTANEGLDASTHKLVPATLAAPDFELPVLEDGVTFNTGEAEVSEIKLTRGDTWVSRANAGDPDISFQVSSLADDINELFMTQVSATVEASVTIGGTGYSAAGYTLAPKKVTGALLLTGEPGEAMLYFPNVEMFASLVVADGDNPSYYNVVATPLLGSAGASWYALLPTASS